MAYSEVLETRGTLRVRLVLDESAGEPYDDGGSPIVRWDLHTRHSGTWHAEQITVTTSYVLDASIVRAAERWGCNPHSLFRRYLRIFHGTTCYVEYDRNDGSDFVYATFDTAHWRQAMGLTDEHLAAHPEIRGQLANMDEYKAWCEGDVYGYVVEREVTWRKDGEPATTMTTWEEVESCWGYYGRGEGERAAREALADQVESDKQEPCAYPNDTEGEHDHGDCQDALHG